ncbi:MAG: sugar phosphate nucleotidyltransferase, partial [Gaiellaceae bacterium]
MAAGMHAIVLAAGEGRRLRPLSERWPKPILPIDGRPVVASLLRELRAGGAEGVVVVTGHLARQVEALLGDGSGFGLEIVYARQRRPDGSADATVCGLRAGARPPVLVVAADTVFRPGDLGRFWQAFMESGAVGAVAARRDPPPDPPHRPPVRIRDGRVERVLDDDPANPLAGAPLWALAEPLVAALPGDQRAPYELAVVVQQAIDAGE